MFYLNYLFHKRFDSKFNLLSWTFLILYGRFSEKRKQLGFFLHRGPGCRWGPALPPVSACAAVLYLY